jgi:radical SAM superfamily enzyme
MRQNVLKNPIDGCVVRTTDGKIQYSLSLDRLKNLDEIPSPYTNHMFDEFFDGKLSPMLQTNRGCPFSCTFCVDGSDSVNQVNKFSMNRVYEEIQYISKHSQNNSSLIITDLNFGMIPRDNEICDYLDESQKNYNYPKQIQVTTGKNSKDKIINAIKKLKESVRFYMSVQSLDQEVLTNIKRDNISVDQMLALGPSIKDAGLQTVSEVILGLPGESTESHIETLRKLVKARISDIQVFQCMLLDGSELNTTEQKKKWDLKTKYRVLPRDFAKLQNGNNIVEIEEIVISSNKMMFDEYLELRLLAFSLWVTNKGVVYDPILKFLHEKGIDVFNLFYTMAQNRNQLHPEIQNVFKLVNNATIEELWDSPEEIESFYQEDSNYNKLLSGESGMNIMFYFQAVVTATALEAWTNSVLENSKKLLIEQNKFDDQISKEFLEISNFCIGISNNPLGDNRMKTNHEFDFKYDIQKWVNDTSDLTLKDFQFKYVQNISFELTLEQFEFVEEKIKIFGKTMNGLSQCLKRIPTKVLWRIPVNKTKSLLN